MSEEKRNNETLTNVNGSGIIVSHEKELEKFWGKLFCTSRNSALGVRKKIIGTCRTSG